MLEKAITTQANLNFVNPFRSHYSLYSVWAHRKFGFLRHSSLLALMKWTSTIKWNRQIEAIERDSRQFCIKQRVNGMNSYNFFYIFFWCFVCVALCVLFFSISCSHNFLYVSDLCAVRFNLFACARISIIFHYDYKERSKRSGKREREREIERTHEHLNSLM